MIHLIKKDLLRILFYVLPVFLIFCIFFLLGSDTQIQKAHHVWIIYMYILVAGAISTLEKNEEKQRGYHFLARLPITDREVVMAKFILLLVVVLILMICNLVLSFTSLVPANSSRIIRLLMLLFGWIYLIFIGLIYVIIYKKGFSRAMTYIWITFIGGLLLFIFLVPSFLKIFFINIPQLIHLALDISPIYWLLVSLLSLYIYYLLMKIAVRVKITARLNEEY